MVLKINLNCSKQFTLILFLFWMLTHFLILYKILFFNIKIKNYDINYKHLIQNLLMISANQTLRALSIVVFSWVSDIYLYIRIQVYTWEHYEASVIYDMYQSVLCI